MLGYALLGALLAGTYGVVHDQVTYSISAEYFTRLKFSQFQRADFGFPPRVFVAEIGFFATWFIARITVPSFPPAVAFRHTARGFAIILACALASSAVGYVLGVLHGSDYSTWETLASTLQISDVPAFVRVAYVHNAAYLGAVLGLIVAIVYLRKLKSLLPRPTIPSPR